MKEYLDFRTIQYLISEHLSGKEIAFLIWSLLNLDAWMSGEL